MSEAGHAQRAYLWPVGWMLRGAVVGLSFTLPFANSAAAGLISLQGQYSNDVEEAAAVANQATYDSLLTVNGGPCEAAQRVETEKCGGGVFSVFESTRELVQTANELTGEGPTEYSLGLDLTGLGEALRWTAAEEYAGQGSSSTDFVGGMLSGLASRITALRFGARGFAVGGMPLEEAQYASASGAKPGLNAGGASGDDEFGRWGGFLNGSYGYGSKDPTGREDAFDFDGYELNGGLDYLLDDNWVVGGAVGYAERQVDFKQKGSIVVDGDVKSDGYSIMPFVLYQGERFFGSVSVGYQQMSFDNTRAIKYPSLNPDVSSTNTRTESDTDSEIWTVYVSAGYDFTFDAFQIEPYVSANYMDITVDKFSERDINNAGFNLIIAKQDFNFSEGTLGTKFSYTFSTSFGVISTYMDLEWHSVLDDESRDIDATYQEVSGVMSAAPVRFRVATDDLDQDYYTYAVGVVTVLPYNFQAYLSYRSVEELKNYSQDVFSGGVRYEF